MSKCRKLKKEQKKIDRKVNKIPIDLKAESIVWPKIIRPNLTFGRQQNRPFVFWPNITIPGVFGASFVRLYENLGCPLGIFRASLGCHL